METRLVLAIEVSRLAQPPIVRGADDPDAPDEDAGGATQTNIPVVEVAADAANSATGLSGGLVAQPFDDDGPIWPDEAAESAMRVEVGARGETSSRPETLTSRAAREAAEAVAHAADEKKNLPPLDDLVNQLPAEIRDTLEDLFRVKFVKVLRVPKSALKS